MWIRSNEKRLRSNSTDVNYYYKNKCGFGATKSGYGRIQRTLIIIIKTNVDSEQRKAVTVEFNGRQLLWD